MKRISVLHPFLFAIYPVSYLYSENIEQFSVIVTLVPSVLLLFLAFVLVKAASTAYDDKDAAVLSVSGFFIWLFSYSAIRSLLLFAIGGENFFRHRYFVFFWVVVLIIFFLGLWKVRFNYQKVVKYLSILAPILILVSFFNIGVHFFKNKPHAYRDEIATPRLTLSTQIKTDSLPDIYYIILDAYTGHEGLKQFLDIDNSEFVQYLRDKGFYVGEKSHSNYSMTRLSLASSLNMDYLPARSNGAIPKVSHVDDSISKYALIAHNKVKASLQLLGYEYLDLTIWNSSAFVDRESYYNRFVSNNFNLSLLRMTVLNRPLVENYFLIKDKREKIIKKFEELRNLPATVGPRFVYAHFLVPHHPYVFDNDGNELSYFSTSGQLASEKDLYRDQLLYVNKEVQKTIDIILANSKRKPIIIIQGDHGAYQMGKTEVDDIKIRMNILNAYYLPESCKKMLYETISPVNTFRIVLNCCFGQDYSLLQDKSYYSSFEDYFEVKDVTKLLAGEE